jgi:hypothetical protein
MKKGLFDWGTTKRGFVYTKMGLSYVFGVIANKMGKGELHVLSLAFD